MPTASAVRRSPRVASSAKSVRRCSPRIFSWWASSAFHAGRALSGNVPVIVSVIRLPFIASPSVQSHVGSGCSRIVRYPPKGGRHGSFFSHALRAADRGANELLCLGHERVQVRRALEALRVNLVDVLRAGRPSREPPARGHDLQAVYRRVVARGPGQLGGDPLAGERLVLDRIG